MKVELASRLISTPSSGSGLCADVSDQIRQVALRHWGPNMLGYKPKELDHVRFTIQKWKAS
jgi:hypothetical protein